MMPVAHAACRPPSVARARVQDPTAAPADTRCTQPVVYATSTLTQDTRCTQPVAHATSHLRLLYAVCLPPSAVVVICLARDAGSGLWLTAGESLGERRACNGKRAAPDGGLHTRASPVACARHLHLPFALRANTASTVPHFCFALHFRPGYAPEALPDAEPVQRLFVGDKRQLETRDGRPFSTDFLRQREVGICLSARARSSRCSLPCLGNPDVPVIRVRVKLMDAGFTGTSGAIDIVADFTLITNQSAKWQRKPENFSDPQLSGKREETRCDTMGGVTGQMPQTFSRTRVARIKRACVAFWLAACNNTIGEVLLPSLARLTSGAIDAMRERGRKARAARAQRPAATQVDTLQTHGIEALFYEERTVSTCFHCDSVIVVISSPTRHQTRLRRVLRLVGVVRRDLGQRRVERQTPSELARTSRHYHQLAVA
ncbi:hypothetical protein GGX14DRAFT_643144 [Mycena pura]|uniref:Uncharacterized protein n=1 Tax=Mycena pura TaxID=153505 RepID=A0AAD6YQM1_9AGAR|nr:hypothetical protein GGX14DRAFT_643144 [Mycena pura]